MRCQALIGSASPTTHPGGPLVKIMWLICKISHLILQMYAHFTHAETMQRPWPKHHSGVAFSHAMPCRNSKQQRAYQPRSLGRCLRTLCALLQAVGSNARVACPLARWLPTLLFLQQAVGCNARGIESTRPLTPSASFLHHFLIVDILGHDNSTLLKKILPSKFTCYEAPNSCGY